MKTIEMQQATNSLAEYARQLHDEALLVTVDGKPVAALLPVEDADAETISLSTNRTFLALLEKSRVRQTAEGGISTEEIRRRLAAPAKDTPA